MAIIMTIIAEKVTAKQLGEYDPQPAWPSSMRTETPILRLPRKPPLDPAAESHGHALVALRAPWHDRRGHRC